MPLNAWELPLSTGFIPPLSELTLAGCLSDSSPGPWGRRVLLNWLSNKADHEGSIDDSDEILFLLNSGSNRTGSFDFQRSAKHYQPRTNDNTTLEELIASVARVENGKPLTEQKDKALIVGSALGGNRPKACITENDKQYIAKFSSQLDTRAVVKSEFVAMRLAAEAGLDVAPVHLLNVAGNDVLLVERFDRVHSANGWHRKTILSALTLFELDKTMGCYASYAELADIIHSEFSYPKDTQMELFKRLVFNILIGNTDDHAGNYSAFWDGSELHLTPAYDICPQQRTGRESTQAIRIIGDRNQSRLAICMEAATKFGLEANAAQQVIEHQILVIKAKWESVCDEANLPDKDRQILWLHQILNPYSIEGYEHLVRT